MELVVGKGDIIEHVAQQSDKRMQLRGIKLRDDVIDQLRKLDITNKEIRRSYLNTANQIVNIYERMSQDERNEVPVVQVGAILEQLREISFLDSKKVQEFRHQIVDDFQDFMSRLTDAELIFYSSTVLLTLARARQVAAQRTSPLYVIYSVPWQCFETITQVGESLRELTSPQGWSGFDNLVRYYFK